MTRQVLRDDSRGKAVAVGESRAERAQRIERAASASTKRFAMTPGQRRNLDSDVEETATSTSTSA